jgi:hypothetical protein
MRENKEAGPNSKRIETERNVSHGGLQRIEEGRKNILMKATKVILRFGLAH